MYFRWVLKTIKRVSEYKQRTSVHVPRIFKFITWLIASFWKGPCTHTTLKHMRFCTWSQQQQNELRKHYKTKQQELFPAIKQRKGEGCAKVVLSQSCISMFWKCMFTSIKVINYAEIKSQSFENNPCLFLTPYVKMHSGAVFLPIWH